MMLAPSLRDAERRRNLVPVRLDIDEIASLPSQ